MATYDSTAAQIKRQQMIADALRTSGNESIQYAPPSGNRAYKHSAWQGVNKILQSVLGAYLGNRAQKQQTELDEKDKAQLAELMTAARTANAPDATEPAPSSDVGPTQVPDQFKSQEDRTRALQAAVLRGQQFGGSSTPYAEEFTKRELFPPVPTDYTLSEGERRVRGTTNEVIAEGQPKQFRESPDDRILVNIVDAKSPKGYRTIARKDWNGEQLYEKPNASTIIAGQMTASAKDLAAEEYLLTGKLPTGIGRSPQASMDIINRAAQLATDRGDSAKVAVVRRAYQKAGQQALGQLTKQQAMVGNFEKTAMNSLKIAQDLSNKVDRMGVPVFDRWAQKGKKSILGDVDVAKFHSANETFITEYAKIMSGSMGNTVTSDSAREHAREMLEPAMTKDQYDGVVDTLKLEMAGRIASFPAQIAELHSQLAGEGQMPGQEAPAPAAAGGPAVGTVVEDGGVKYRFKGGNPNDQANWEQTQ